MYLNDLKPTPGSKQNSKRVGRGIGSGLGKTAGRGHKGQRSRAGGYHKVGFEGGQMPLYRRIPKFGFTSRKAVHCSEVRLSELNKINAEVVDLNALKAADIVNESTKVVKVFASGQISKPITLKGIRVTAGAKAAIIAAGGKVEE